MSENNKNSLEDLRGLIEFRMITLGLNLRIHEVCCYIAKDYLSRLIFGDGNHREIEFNTGSGQGADIKVSDDLPNGGSCKYYAEVKSSLKFESDPFYDDAKKLRDAEADHKFLVVLYRHLEDETMAKLQNRQKSPLDVKKHGIEVISIERMLDAELPRKGSIGQDVLEQSYIYLKDKGIILGSDNLD